jgi:hypothetical protein
MPALLSCGHIICQQCTLDKPLQCFICKGKNVNVKLENFQTFRDYLQAVNRPTNGGSIYNFSISLLSVSITKILAGQSGERIV